MSDAENPRAAVFIPADHLAVSLWPERKGGQQVGTPSGVRVEHLPSGLVACVNTDRSQYRNRAIALDMILGGLTSSSYRP